jgi:tetratricopeptide (TPR) repeat protein
VFYVRLTLGQTISFQQQQVQIVFDKLFDALGNDISKKPKIDYNRESKVDAKYNTNDNDIQVYSGLYKLCQSMGSDSTNALAFVLGHELTHFFQHQKGDKFFSKSTKEVDSSIDTIAEYNADVRGAFHAYYAGYKIKDIVPKFIEELYKTKHFGEKIRKYATKATRMKVAMLAQNKIDTMVQVYEFANYMNVVGYFDAAIAGYNYIEKDYPGKEIYNNIAVAYANYVQKELPLVKLDDPMYAYPMYIDRLAGFVGNRGEDIENDEEKMKLRVEQLNLAMQNLDKAIKLDPNYNTSKINRLCILFLQGKRENLPSQINALKNTIKTPLDLEKLRLMESIVLIDGKQKDKAKMLLTALLNSKNENIKIIAQTNLDIAVKSKESKEIEKNKDCTLKFKAIKDKTGLSKYVVLQDGNTFQFKKSQTDTASIVYFSTGKSGKIWAQRFMNSQTPITDGVTVGKDINVALQNPAFGTPTIMNWHSGQYYYFYECNLILLTNHKGLIMEWLHFDVD